MSRAGDGSDLPVVLARIVLGLAATLHGIADTFGVWGAPYFGATAADMAARAGVSPDFLFYVVSVVLIVLGALLLLGIAARKAALVLLLLVVWHAIANGRITGYFHHAGGGEYLLALAALCAVVAGHGAGGFQVQFKKQREG